MAVPLLQTKLFAPLVRSERVSRPRLIERLNAGLWRDGLKKGLGFARKLTLVAAAAGFGKTTLVVEWLSGAESPFTWLSLDEEDNDPARFMRYLVAALRAAVHAADEELGTATQGWLGSPQLPAVDVAMTPLINEIAAASEPFVLVLDDYHDIHAGWIHSAVEYLLVHQPPQLHLVLITRTDPPLPLPRLRVRGQVAEIRAEDLRFTRDESAAFLEQALGEPLEPETVAALEARTEGWIAALQLAAMHLAALQLSSLAGSAQGTDQEAIAGFVAAFRGSHRYVIDYLADEVLNQQPAETRRFLCQTAILDRLTAPLCEALTGQKESAAILAQLERANLFLVPLDERREWYRYHALFRDFLRTQLDPESRAALHGQAARWFAAHALLPEAAGHALASGDMDLAAAVIARAADEALRSAAIATLSGWLNALPEEIVRAHAELATYKGLVLYMSDRRTEAAAYADLAEQIASADAPRSSHGQRYCLQAHAALYKGRPGEAIRLSRQALEFLGEDDGVFRDLALNVLGQVLEQEGDTAGAADVYRDAFVLRRRTGDQLGTMVVLTNLAFALNELGRRQEALAYCRQVAGDRMPGARRDFSVREGAYLPWSLLSLEANELDLAQQQASRALALAQQVRILDGVWWALLFLAQVHLAKGEIEAMRQVCRETRQLDARGLQGVFGPWFAALEAQASLQRGGDLDAAERWAQTAGLSPDDVPGRWDAYTYAIYVRALLAQDRLHDAKKLLATMEGVAERSRRLRRLITVYLQQARLAQAMGRGDRARARVEDALRLAAPQGYRRAFLDEGPAILALLPRLRPAAPEFVDSLLAASPQGLPSGGNRDARPSPLVEPLTDREREILRLIAAGRSNPEIAELLYLSLNTVKWHARNLYGKLGAGNRVQAVARAQELDLL